ncbi:DUF1674 domain-containing protein [Salinisphaera sp. Q1T1-3]|nr:DUF1674 domain-containing protein [Salinisphaera sp. Q1T1-3]
MPDSGASEPSDASDAETSHDAERFDPAERPKEYGGPKGPDPVRYGDWEKNGRCIDF